MPRMRVLHGVLCFRVARDMAIKVGTVEAGLTFYDLDNILSSLLTGGELRASLSTNLDERRLERMVQVYCVKCKKKVEAKNPKQVTLKNKRPAVQGVCPKCGTKVFRIGKV